MQEHQTTLSASVQHPTQQGAPSSVTGHLLGVVSSLHGAVQATSRSPDLHRAVAGRQEEEMTSGSGWMKAARLLSHSLGGGEEVAAVGGDAVDGALVALQLAQGPQRVCVPQLQHPAPAATQQHRGRGDHAQRAHPVTVGVGDLLLGRSNRKQSVKVASFRLSRPLMSDLQPVPAAGLCGPGPTS